MKKILIFFAVYILLSVSSFGESYYFKGCKITENINADYLINFEKNIINAKIVAENGKFQKFEDKILLVTDKKIYSEIIPKNLKNSLSGDKTSDVSPPIRAFSYACIAL